MFKKQGKFLLFDLPAFADWLRDFTPHRRVWRVQNHHTYSPSYADFNGSNHFAKLTGMENYHVNTNHWSEIAQNLTTFPDGAIAVCRSFDKTPAGIVGANGGALCIEHLGNFDLGGDAMTDEQRTSIVKLNAMLCQRYMLTPDASSIIYHHWFAAKSCPGSAFFNGNTIDDAQQYFLPLVRQELAVLNAAMPAKPAVCCGNVTADSLNIRSGPGKDYPKLGALNAGEPVNGYAVENNWWRIHPTQSRWVYGGYVH